jgi:hypothetical protein
MYSTEGEELEMSQESTATVLALVVERLVDAAFMDGLLCGGSE